jgi:quinol monooxygenase YgiN
MNTAATGRATDKHVVTVVFQVRPEHSSAFRASVLHNAAASLASEPGCMVFDVCESPNGPEFFLYELYENTAAFEEHLTTAHFKAFDAACAAWSVSKRISRYERLRAVNTKD